MAAEPILASSLWTIEQSSAHPDRPNKRRRLATGCQAIDTSLYGGFDYGFISCISADTESGSKELSYCLIASHLLLSNRAEATVVDTTNSFDVRRLHTRLVALLREKGNDGDAKEQAVRVLERMRIMKAFDLVGVSECIAELREALDTRSHEHSSETSNSTRDNIPAPRGTVEDSEDEEEEMLDNLATPKHPTPPPPDMEDESPRNLLVIDNITHVTSLMLKTNHVQGQALLTTFMRSLAHLTRAHDLCSIIHNTTITYAPSNSSAEPTPSIFSSCSLRPALGKTFAYLLDLHLLLHRVPVTASDAKVVYASHSAVPIPSRMLACVLEVMQDRYSDRVGRWSAFQPNAEGGLAAVGGS